MRSRRALGLAVAGLMGALAACGSSSSSSTATTGAAGGATTSGAVTSAAASVSTSAGANTTAAAATTAAASNAAWDGVIAAAKKEGKVTIYSSQAPDLLKEVGDKFKAKYGIEVEVVRDIDSTLTTKLDAERSAGKLIADVWINAAQSVEAAKSAEKWFVAPTGPAFDNKDYDKATRVKGDYFEVNSALLTFGWNTKLYPAGLKDYPDLLNPELAGGKIGVIKPAAASIVDFYLYLDETYGAGFTEKLCAQKPRIYPSSLPIGQALTSGEIAASAFNQALVVEKESGAPVDFGIAPKAWGARFWGAVLDKAPHPNAAQLLADFVITADGQASIAKRNGAVLPNVPGALTTTDKVRVQDLSKLTPEFVKTFGENWDKMCS